MADILFIHSNFPGQFGFIAEALMARGDRVAAVAAHTAQGIPGVTMARWRTGRGTTPGIMQLAVRAEADLIRGRAAVEAMVKLRDDGFDPAVIVGHPGWGETLFAAEIFPKARQILHAEFYYNPTGGDVGFDPEFGEPSFDDHLRIRAKNGGLALAYAQAEALVCPTPFQRNQLPVGFRDRAHLIHEGVDVDVATPDPSTVVRMPDGRSFSRGKPVITFINRKFEPLRGYHIFMRALPKLLAEVPDAEVVLIGMPAKSGYGATAPDGRTWQEVYLDEVRDRLDMSRVHFVGAVSYPTLINFLRISAAHVYWTYPFVLSWSVLDAMACGALMIGSDTAPVRDIIVDGENGLLSDFFDHDRLADLMVRAIREQKSFDRLRIAARDTVVRGWDRKRDALPAWLRLIDQMMG
jgi:glycosyltransferase involved in cell wall biosynthesis